MLLRPGNLCMGISVFNLLDIELNSGRFFIVL